MPAKLTHEQVEERHGDMVRAACAEVGATFHRFEYAMDKGGNQYLRAICTCGVGHPLSPRVSNVRQYGLSCTTCRDEANEKMVIAAFTEIGGVFHHLESRMEGKNTTQHAIGECCNGHPLSPRVSDVRRHQGISCTTCRDESNEKMVIAAFTEIGGVFHHLESRMGGKKLRQHAIGECGVGHPLSPQVSHVRRQQGISCRVCRDEGRTGVIYLFASHESAYVGQSIALDHRIRGHTSELYNTLPAAAKAHLSGIITVGADVRNDLSDHEQAVQRARSLPRRVHQPDTYFTILRPAVDPAEINKVERYYIRLLVNHGIPLRNRHHNPQWSQSTGEYTWESFEANVGTACAFILAGDKVPKRAENCGG